MSIPEKYSHIDFKPPSGVRREAEYGLKLRREYGRGGTAVGIARARDLANGVQLSPSTVRRMKAFFDRHQSDEKAEGFNRGDKNYPSNGLIANKLWGGPSGYSFAKKVVEQMNAADEKEGRSLRPFGSTQGIKPKVTVVHGPPAAGKTTYVMQNKGDNDVVFDFDKIMSALSGLPPHQKNENLISYCTDVRDLIIKRALRGSDKIDRTWIVTTKISDEMKGKLSDIPVEFVHINTPREECLKRIDEDPDRSQSAEELRRVVEEYFQSTESRSVAVLPNVERRFLGNFNSTETQDPDLLKVERRADPSTGKPQTYLVGYAARFQTDSLLMGDFVERIDPAAFEIVTKRQDEDGKPVETRCLFNHDPNHLLGRFPTTMKMYVDTKGLRYECLLPESRADVAESVARGDLKGSSFSFVVADGGEKWSYENGRSIRLVTKIKALLDCGPVTYPAYGDATVAVAKRSYEQFAARKAETVESRNAVRAKAAKVAAETREFLEKRAFCKTGSGGGIDNSCGKDGATGGGKGSETKKNIAKAAKKEKGYEAKRKSSFADRGSRIGVSVGMTVGLTGGLTGLVIGGVIGGLAGGYLGMMIPNPNKTGVVKAWKPLAKKKKSSRSEGESSSVDEVAASLGVDETAIKSAVATFADSDDAQGGLSVTDKGALVITASGIDSFIVLSPGNPWVNEQSVSLFVGSPDSVDRVLLAETAAEVLGASSVAVGNANREVASALLKSGYAQVGDGVLAKSVSAESRAFCPNGKGNGIDNSCSSSGAKSGSKIDDEGYVPKGDDKDVFEKHGNGPIVPKSDVFSKYGNGPIVPKSDVFSKYGKGPVLPESTTKKPADFSKKSTGDYVPKATSKKEAAKDATKKSPPPKYMEWDKSKDHKSKEKTAKAQDFLDKARTEQMSKGGKDKGMADEGGGVQTWSKGDHFPWTPKQVGTDEGYIQGVHPDGSKTEKFPFKNGETSDAYKKMSDEVKRRKGKRSYDAQKVARETIEFLKSRRGA